MELIDKMQMIGDVNYKLDAVMKVIDNFNSNLISQIPDRQKEIHKLTQDAKDLVSKISKEFFKKGELDNELLMAKKDGFFNGYEMWETDDFVIDYDTVRKEFCLRSITKGYGLGKTRFYESDYKKTWWLKEDKSE